MRPEAGLAMEWPVEMQEVVRETPAAKMVVRGLLDRPEEVMDEEKLGLRRGS